MLTEAFKKRMLELSGVAGDFKITDDMRKEVAPYKTSEEFLRAGGFSIDTLDRAAFGFADSDITELMPNQLNIKWKDDMLNPPQKQKHSGLSKIQWAKSVDFSEPIDVSYSKGKFWIEDGHHRYYAANILNQPLKVNLEINEQPLRVLSNGLSYDDYIRTVFNIIKSNQNKL